MVGRREISSEEPASYAVFRELADGLECFKDENVRSIFDDVLAGTTELKKLGLTLFDRLELSVVRSLATAAREMEAPSKRDARYPLIKRVRQWGSQILERTETGVWKNLE